MYLYLLSLFISLFIAYVFIDYTRKINENPMCRDISPNSRELISIYGYVKMFFALLSLFSFVYLLVTGNLNKVKRGIRSRGSSRVR